MFRSTVSKVMWVGRATVFLVGLAVILALVFGVASAALGANSKAFLLGRTNLSTMVTTLIKEGPGPALSLQVDSGPPLAVNSSAKVDNLNVDRIDNLDSGDFVRSLGSRVYGAKLEPIAPDVTATLMETGAPHLQVNLTCADARDLNRLTITNEDTSGSVEVFVGVDNQESQDRELAMGQSFIVGATPEGTGTTHVSLMADQGGEMVQIETYVVIDAQINAGTVDSCTAAAQALELQR